MHVFFQSTFLLGKVLPVIRMRQIKKGPLERRSCNVTPKRSAESSTAVEARRALAAPDELAHGDILKQSVERHSKNIHAYPNFSLRILHPFDFLRGFFQ